MKFKYYETSNLRISLLAFLIISFSYLTNGDFVISNRQAEVKKRSVNKLILRSKRQATGACVNINDYSCNYFISVGIQCTQSAYIGLIPFSTYCCQACSVCSTNPCLNGGVCTPLTYNNYQCSCPSGFTGIICQNSINSCSSSPCLNGATCINLASGYNCQCMAGYTGSNCQNSINSCSTSPCLNGGTCLNNYASGYNCQCMAGYTGTNCQNQINCSSNPCLNGALCSTTANGGYSCVCQPTFTGTNCQTSISACSNVNDYTCNYFLSIGIQCSIQNAYIGLLSFSDYCCGSCQGITKSQSSVNSANMLIDDQTANTSIPAIQTQKLILNEKCVDLLSICPKLIDMCAKFSFKSAELNPCKKSCGVC